MSATEGTLLTVADVAAAIPAALRGIRPNTDLNIPGRAGLIVEAGWRCAYLVGIGVDGLPARIPKEVLSQIRTTLVPALEKVVRARLAGAAPEVVEQTVHGLRRLLNQLGVSAETERRVQGMAGLIRRLLDDPGTPREFVESLDVGRDIPDPALLSAGGTGTKVMPPKLITWISVDRPTSPGAEPRRRRHFRSDESRLSDGTRGDVVHLTYTISDKEWAELERLRAAGVRPPQPLFRTLTSEMKIATETVLRVVDNNAELTAVSKVRDHYGGSLDYLDRVLRDAATESTTLSAALPNTKPKLAPRTQLGLTLIGKIDALVTDNYVGPTMGVIADDAAGKAVRPPASTIKTYWLLDAATLAPLPRVGGGLFEVVAPKLLKTEVTKLANEFAQKLLKAVKSSH